MHAILRRYAYDPARLGDARGALARVRQLHEQQPGYVGSYLIDDGTHWVALNLWQSEQAAGAGRDAIGAQVRHLLEPFVAGEPRLIAVGPVVAADPDGLRL